MESNCGYLTNLGPTATLSPSWNICVSMGALGELRMRYTHQVCSLHAHTKEDGAQSGCDCLNGCPQKATNERYSHQVRRAWEPPWGHGWVNGCPPEPSNEGSAPSPQPVHKNKRGLEPTAGSRFAELMFSRSQERHTCSKSAACT